jgi:hypothetical protein
MMSERDLVEAIFQTALKGCDADVKARKNAIWDAGVVLLADVLRETDSFSRERRLELNARATEFDVHGLLTFLPKHLTRGGAS